MVRIEMLTPEAKRRIGLQKQRENRMISEAIEYKDNLQKGKEREKLNNEIRKAEERYNALKKSYDNFVEYKRTYQYSKDPVRRKEEVKSNQGIEKEQELEVREAMNYLNYLKANSGKIQEGYSTSSLVDYASSKATQDLNRWKAIYEGKKYTQKQVELGNKPLYNSSGKIVGYLDPKTYDEIKSTDYFKNKNITAENLKHYNQLIDYANKVGLENVSPEIRNQIDSSYIKNNKEVIQELRNQMPPGDKLLYDPKTYQIKGIDSAMLKRNYSGISGVESYFKEIEKSPFLQMYINKLNYGQSVIPTPLEASKRIDLSMYNKGGIANQLKASIETLKYYVNATKDNPFYLPQMFKENAEARLRLFERRRTKLEELQKKNIQKTITQREREKLNELEKNVAKDTIDAYLIITDWILTTLSNSAVGGVLLANSFIRNPIETAKRFPVEVWNGLREQFSLLKTSRGNERTRLAVELVVNVGVGSGTYKMIPLKYRSFFRNNIRSGVNYVITKLDPKGTFVKGRIIPVIKKPEEKIMVKGKERLLKKRVKKPSIKRPIESIMDYINGRKAGQFKKWTNEKGLDLELQTVSSSATPPSEQILLAGKKLDAIVSAMANRITTLIRKKRIVRKPFPNENSFPIKIKRLLNKFDDGKRLTNKEFIEINDWLRKNVAENATLLERSVYFYPDSGLRKSRLKLDGEDIEGSIIDLIRGNAKLFGNKPEIVVLRDVLVDNPPKSLRSIVNKIKKGKDLTKIEMYKYLRWQVEAKTGKVKPVGSLIFKGGYELEVTSTPGEYLRRIKVLGRVYMNGKRVPIVLHEIWRPNKTVLNKIKQAMSGKLSLSAVKDLERYLSNKLNRRIILETADTKGILRKNRIKRLSRRDYDALPVVRLDRKALRVIYNVSIVGLRRSLYGRTDRFSRMLINRFNLRNATRPTRGPIRTPTRRPTRRTPTRPTRRTPTRPTRRTPTRPTRRPIRTPTRPTRRTPTRPTRIPPRRPTRRTDVLLQLPTIKREMQKKNLSKSVMGYYVLIKRNNRLIKTTPRPFELSGAKDYLAYLIDHSLSKTAFIIPDGKTKNVYVLPKAQQNYYQKVSHKLRPYRIRYGKKKQLVNGYIEKRKYGLDTANEKRELKLSKRINRRTIRRTTKRKITPAQRKVLLKRLEKARAVRRRNIRKR